MAGGGQPAERAHAVLSASGAARWLACPPSARLELKYPDTTSDYAREGTLAHRMAEVLLRQHFEKADAGSAEAELAEIRADPLYKRAMDDHIETFVDYVLEIYDEAKKTTPDAQVYIEAKISFEAWVPEGFGTADVVIVADGMMHVIDLKYGKGVEVQAEGNPQIRLYGLGAYDMLKYFYGIAHAKLHIFQPRLGGASTETIPMTDLLYWADTEVQPIAEQAWEGLGGYRAGKHCQFCRARFRCSVYHAYMLRTLDFNFADYSELTDAQLGQILLAASEVANWWSQTKKWAEDQAVNHGLAIPGYKLVAGRSNRQITDPAAAIEKLEALGFARDETTKLLGITALEELVGRRKLTEALAPWLDKPPGAPTLVPYTDKRPAISGAAAAARDFEEN